MDPELKRQVLAQVRRSKTDVLADPVASPTGFPFQVVQLEGSLSEAQVFEQRQRICDLGVLRELYRTSDGKVGYRCPAEPVNEYIRKGGDAAAAVGRKCLCNALHANIGLGQLRSNGEVERPLLTAGADLRHLAHFLDSRRGEYRAVDVIQYILGEDDSAS